MAQTYESCPRFGTETCCGQCHEDKRREIGNFTLTLEAKNGDSVEVKPWILLDAVGYWDEWASVRSEVPRIYHEYKKILKPASLRTLDHTLHSSLIITPKNPNCPFLGKESGR